MTPSVQLRRVWPVTGILLIAFALRVLGLTRVPPGWRDDEVIETTVHAQIVLSGHYPLYFIQAEGHEPIYHYLTAGWIALVGESLFTVRLVSVFFGLATVAAAYRFARPLFGKRTALLTALLITISFWALMYSRTKIRHISEVPFALLAFTFLFEMLKAQTRGRRIGGLIKSAIFTTLALYTYLAATTLILILIGFGIYLFVVSYFQTSIRKQQAVYVFAVLALAVILYLPLANAIRANATRLSVVGGPLTALREGNFGPLIENTVNTLAMFGNTGDNEALYNISGRPILGLVGFYCFLGGLLIAVSKWRDPRYGFLLVWLVGGLAPGFASNPAASLGHTITVLPVTYILAALPIAWLRGFKLAEVSPRLISFGAGALLLATTAARDLPDYFVTWPALPAVQGLYKADLHQLAQSLRSEPPTTYVLNGLLSKWDRVSFTLEGVALESPPRWVNADWAIVFPAVPARDLFTLAAWQVDAPPQHPASVHFENDLTFEGWTQDGADILAHWNVGPSFRPVEPDMGSSVDTPPFPVKAFLHALDGGGNVVAGSDRFDVDAYTLQAGDRFIQRHSLDAPAGTYMLEIGLYDPTSGVRYVTDEGEDAVGLGEVTLP